MKVGEAKELIGCCGLYCGLCNKYQSKSPSRCIGCQLGEQHSWCSIWNCCIKKHSYRNCTECEEIFICEIYKRRKVKEWIPVEENINKIKNAGMKSWINEQIKRQKLLEELLNNYNEGRSMNYYCKVCSRMPVDSIRKALQKAKQIIEYNKIGNNDMKKRASIVKEELNNLAIKANVILK